MNPRAALDVDTLLKIVLVLVIVWIGIEIIEGVLNLVFSGFLSFLRPLIGLIIVVLILLWFFDKI